MPTKLATKSCTCRPPPDSGAVRFPRGNGQESVHRTDVRIGSARRPPNHQRSPNGGYGPVVLGLAQSPDESFQLADHDTVASVTTAHQKACPRARAAVADLPLDAVVTGHRAGPRTLRWVYLQVLRELAHHCGHADILREQVLTA